MLLVYQTKKKNMDGYFACMYLCVPHVSLVLSEVRRVCWLS